MKFGSDAIGSQPLGNLQQLFFSQRPLGKYAAIDYQYHFEDEINFIIIFINKLKVTTAKMKKYP